MKTAGVFLIAIGLWLGSCTKPFNSFLQTSNKKLIAIQPLGNFNREELAFIEQAIKINYDRRVIILQPVDVPERFFNHDFERYSADSLVMFLAGRVNDSISEVVGLIHENIFATRESNHPAVLYEVRDVFGLGYLPGNSCVISDYKLMTSDTALYHNRLRTVVLHEIGHNAGLPHCTVNNCIMSEANGNMVNLNNNRTNYCSGCRRLLRVK